MIQFPCVKGRIEEMVWSIIHPDLKLSVHSLCHYHIFRFFIHSHVRYNDVTFMTSTGYDQLVYASRPAYLSFLLSPTTSNFSIIVALASGVI